MAEAQIVNRWKSSSKENALPKSLLTAVTFENVVFSLRWSCFWCGIPYEYDKAQHRIFITKKTIRIWSIATLAQAVNFAYFCGAMAFTLLGEESNVSRSKSNMFDIAFGFLITMTSGALLIVNVHVGAFRRDEFCTFVNAAIHYCIFLKGSKKISYNREKLKILTKY